MHSSPRAATDAQQLTADTMTREEADIINLLCKKWTDPATHADYYCAEANVQLKWWAKTDRIPWDKIISHLTELLHPQQPQPPQPQQPQQHMQAATSAAIPQIIINLLCDQWTDPASGQVYYCAKTNQKVTWWAKKDIPWADIIWHLTERLHPQQPRLPQPPQPGSNHSNTCRQQHQLPVPSPQAAIPITLTQTGAAGSSTDEVQSLCPHHSQVDPITGLPWQHWEQLTCLPIEHNRVMDAGKLASMISSADDTLFVGDKTGWCKCQDKMYRCFAQGLIGYAWQKTSGGYHGMAAACLQCGVVCGMEWKSKGGWATGEADLQVLRKRWLTFFNCPCRRPDQLPQQ